MANVYIVYSGVYPFDTVLGLVAAPEDRPDLALQQAIKKFSTPGEPSPVVEYDELIQP
jgi:hypothetical protein